jgi:hypothetical protein
MGTGIGSSAKRRVKNGLGNAGRLIAVLSCESMTFYSRGVISTICNNLRERGGYHLSIGIFSLKCVPSIHLGLIFILKNN